MLKQSFLALITLGALSGAALAADAIDQIPAAPVVDSAPAFSWEGFYAGGAVGYGWTESKSTANGVTRKNEFDGARFSGFAGYNFEAAPSVIVGVEGDLGYAWGNKTVLTSKISAGINGSARVRAGYALDRALVYAAGGYAGTDSELSTPLGKDSKVLHGWTVGAGVDYAFTDKLFGRVEYRYSDYGKTTYRTGPISSTSDVNEHAVNVGLGLKF